MPHFKPIDDWNKDNDVKGVIDIFGASKERHKKDTKDDFELVNPHKTHPTKKKTSSKLMNCLSFIDGFVPSDTLISQ